MKTTRKQYKDVKKFDHAQFDRFCESLIQKGYNEGIKAAPKQEVTPEEIRKAFAESISEICEVISTVKGIGPAKLKDIRKALEKELSDDTRDISA
ncbi:MAG: hypothetical protein IJ711_00385 [Lachnospiraceae bacterium]|nr:hypothetical protein [Clostridia bacterium]MBR1691213.1 hypothetical protein [Lachnospiraceae bacterium]